MPLLPSLLGGVEVRQRRPRYHGEPTYKRLDFIRTNKTTNTDHWDLVRTTYPIRFVQAEPLDIQCPPQYPQVAYPQWQQIQNEQAYHQDQRPYPRLQSHGYYEEQYHHPQLPRQTGHQHIPVPPRHPGLPQIDYPGRPQGLLEHHKNDGGVFHLGPANDDEDDDDGDVVFTYVEPKSRSRSRPNIRMPSQTRLVHAKGRSKSHIREPKEDKDYSSESEDGRRRGRRHSGHRSTSRSRSRGPVVYESDEDSLVDAIRQSGRRKGGRGW